MSAGIEVKDQLGRTVCLEHAPKRIVSVVPSQTELLCDLGLEQEVVGITKFCVHPPHWRKEKQVIGGTKNLRLQAIDELKPDLIIANKEENTKDDIAALERQFPVWISDVLDLPSALKMIEGVGEVCGVDEKSKALTEQVAAALDQIHQHPLPPKRVLYLIWKNPYMAAGPNTFIHNMLSLCGLENALTDPTLRYPELSIQAIQSLDPDLILLSSEPFPFKGKHTVATQQDFPNTQLLEVDGEIFSWYGSRLLKAPAYIQQLRQLEDFA